MAQRKTTSKKSSSAKNGGRAKKAETKAAAAAGAAAGAAGEAEADIPFPPEIQANLEAFLSRSGIAEGEISDIMIVVGGVGSSRCWCRHDRATCSHSFGHLENVATRTKLTLLRVRVRGRRKRLHPNLSIPS